MKANLFEPMVVGWSVNLVWSKVELKKATTILLAISKANAGEIAADVEVDATISNQFALQQLEGALARRVAPYAKMLREKFIRPKYATALVKQTSHVLPELVSHEWNDCIDINNDDAKALIKLPGISRGFALKIIRYRTKKGRFSELAQLTEIKGIGATTLEGLKDRAFCGASEQGSLPTAELSAFMQEPTFQTYVALITESKDAQALSISENKDPKLQILVELKKSLDDVKHNKYGTAINLHYTRASNVQIGLQRQARAKEINDKGANTVDCGALLFDNQYLPFIGNLIKKAKKSIHVTMFFMKYEDGAGYIVNSLVEDLIKAHQRGLDVKVILDKDAEGDAAKSRLINEPAFHVLKKNGVAVLYDRDDRMTHSKLVVVDDKHVVVGSHNWTAGSFLAYDDTSIYVESEELGLIYQNIFSASWDQYGSMEKLPRP